MAKIRFDPKSTHLYLPLKFSINLHNSMDSSIVIVWPPHLLIIEFLPQWKVCWGCLTTLFLTLSLARSCRPPQESFSLQKVALLAHPPKPSTIFQSPPFPLTILYSYWWTLLFWRGISARAPQTVLWFLWPACLQIIWAVVVRVAVLRACIILYECDIARVLPLPLPWQLPRFPALPNPLRTRIQ